jgi:hypothetical protein
MLVAPWPESVTEPKELRLIDWRQDRNHRSLNDLVFQARHSHFELHFDPVDLWARLK